MNKRLNQRNFLKFGGVSGTGTALSGLVSKNKTNAEVKPIKIGFVGLGGRGSYHLDVALGMEGIEVPAICEIKDVNLYRAKRWIEESGRPAPVLYGKTKTDFVRMCETEDLDVVICATPWEWHTPVCLAGMKNDKNVVSEVPMVQTIDEAWEIVETHESTGRWATLGLEGLMNLSLFNMVRKGLFGEIIHAESGYIHDLRMVKFNPQEEPWRLQHSFDRNGNLYPDHPMRKILPVIDVNHGDRLDFLVSMSTKGVMLNEYAAQYYGEKHPYAIRKAAQGDYNATLLRTVKGKVVTLNFDTNTPHPRGLLRYQGTKGVYFGSSYEGGGLGQHVYFDGISPKEHQWEDAEKYFKEYEHPVDKNYKPQPRKGLRGHGGGRTTPLRWHRLVQALRNRAMPDWDVYDSVTMSAIVPLTEMSVMKKSKPVDFPDFTKGKWEIRPHIEYV